MGPTLSFKGIDNAAYALPTITGKDDVDEGRRRAGIWNELIDTGREDLWQIREWWLGVAPQSLRTDASRPGAAHGARRWCDSRERGRGCFGEREFALVSL